MPPPPPPGLSLFLPLPLSPSFLSTTLSPAFTSLSPSPFPPPPSLSLSLSLSLSHFTPSLYFLSNQGIFLVTSLRLSSLDCLENVDDLQNFSYFTQSEGETQIEIFCLFLLAIVPFSFVKGSVSNNCNGVDISRQMRKRAYGSRIGTSKFDAESASHTSTLSGVPRWHTCVDQMIGQRPCWKHSSFSSFLFIKLCLELNSLRASSQVTSSLSLPPSLSLSFSLFHSLLLSFNASPCNCLPLFPSLFLSHALSLFISLSFHLCFPLCLHLTSLFSPLCFSTSLTLPPMSFFLSLISFPQFAVSLFCFSFSVQAT